MTHCSIGLVSVYSTHNIAKLLRHHRRFYYNNSVHLVLFFICSYCTGKVHPCPFFNIVFLSLLLSTSSSFSFLCVLWKPENLEMWPNHYSFRLLTMVGSLLYSPAFCEHPRLFQEMLSLQICFSFFSHISLSKIRV